MPNDIEKVEVDEEIAELPDTVEGEEDTTDYKALAAKNAGIAKRYKTKFEKSKLAVKIEKGVEKALESKQEPKTGFDDTEHLFLDVKQVPPEDRNWLFEEQKTTGKGIRQLVGFKYVQDHLNEQNQKRTAEAGLPNGTRKAGSGSSDSADAWLSKINSGKANLSDISDFSLRSEVVKLRERNDKSSNRPNW